MAEVCKSLPDSLQKPYQNALQKLAYINYTGYIGVIHLSTGLITSSSPHLRTDRTTPAIMKDVLIALLPALFAAVYFFGLRALLLSIVCIAAAILSEYVTNKAMKKDATIGDYSAAVTGLLLAFNLPPSIPLWIAVIGCVFAIVVAKQLFGGLGHNFINPALAARAFLMASWPVEMTHWLNPGADAVSTATPLAIIKNAGETASSLPTLFDMFTGNIGGCIGETSALALLIGGIWLLARRVISPEIPFFYMGTVALFTFVAGGKGGLFTGDPLFHILAGGLMLGAFFMATDYTTSPVTMKGRIIMAVGCGVLTSVIRLYGGYPEGVSYSILIMNLVVPLIDKSVKPRTFGGEKANA